MIYHQLPQEERDRLLAVLDAGYAMGAGCARWMATDVATELLIYAVIEDYLTNREIIPEWLRAARERVAALGDATPPPELEEHHA